MTRNDVYLAIADFFVLLMVVMAFLFIISLLVSYNSVILTLGKISSYFTGLGTYGIMILMVVLFLLIYAWYLVFIYLKTRFYESKK